MTTIKHTTNASSPFDVHITPEALLKLNLYSAAALTYANSEIGGMARLSIRGKDVFVIDVQMFEQVSSSVSFEIGPDAMNEFNRKMIKEGRADELHEWCSIVHSHPENMSPGMSSVDVEAIKRFAEDEDAFSLIISAKHSANSTWLYMHYCTNVRGQKHLIHNIPVKVALSGERLTLAKSMSQFLVSTIGTGNLSTDDIEQIDTLTRVFCTTTLPSSWGEERAKLKEQIDAHVKELLKPVALAPTPRTYYPNNTPPPSHGRSWSSGSNDYLDVNRSLHSMTDDEWAEYNNYGYGMLTDNRSETHRLWDSLCDLRDQIETGLDKRKRKIGKSRMRKFQTMYETRIANLNTYLRQKWNVGIGDMVTISPEFADDDDPRIKEPVCVLWPEFAKTGGSVSFYIDEVQGVRSDADNMQFWPHELIVHETCDDPGSLVPIAPDETGTELTVIDGEKTA